MQRQPYSQFKPEELILRDLLAVERTVLANERTFLAYVRTALAFAAGGVSLIHFLGSMIAEIFGIGLIVVGSLTLLWGLRRFMQIQAAMNRLGKGNVPGT